MIQKIIVPLDGSELAEQALKPASQLAQQFEAEIVLVQVPIPKATASSSIAVWPEQTLDEARADTKTYLKNIAEQYDFISCRPEIIEGDAAGAILDFAREEQVDLIVMSTHGRSGVERWLLGSVTERVLRQASCPVLAIRGEHPIAKVLITLDGSTFSETALSVGVPLAQSLGATITLLRVSKVPDYVNPIGIAEMERVVPGLGGAALSGFYERTVQYLQKVQARLADEGVTVETAVAHGTVPQNILKVADEQAIDLIVMATHGHTGLFRWVYGSVTEKVLHASQKHMLIVRPTSE